MKRRLHDIVYELYSRERVVVVVLFYGSDEFFFVAIRNSKINHHCLFVVELHLSLPFSACCCCCVVFFSSSCHRRSPKKQKSYTSTNTYTILKILKIHQPKKKAVEKFLLDFFQKNFFVCVEIDRSVRIERRQQKTQNSEYKNLRFLIHLYHVCSNK